MKKTFLLLAFLGISVISAFAQQASEIDSKSVKLPRYADLETIRAAIPSGQQGMMVYNMGTASNWYFNGSVWVDISKVVVPLSISHIGPANTFTSQATGSTGSAAQFNITNPSSLADVLVAKTEGTGFAGNFIGTNSINAKGFTQLGELSPKIKTVTFGAYIGAGSVETITHNLDAGKILSVNVYASLEEGLPPHLRIPPSFISLGTEYYYDYYFDDTKIYFIIPGSSTKVKNFFARVLITYTE